VLEDLVLDADDRDLLRLLGLLSHLDHHLAADRADPLVFGHGVGDDLEGKIGLETGTVAAARLELRLRGVAVAVARRRP
jgi:hypothetical protein